ncbi:hypothetical protein CHS0354_038897 [Potamilus streckersoni]|uniref:Kinesin-like protein n=1 Tax=Potamilus streckersoni TaxID=2493646 RepID=A0AAE0SS34_9BIVA|nr:hypothetical protein CHS0354_038897 [Potamilus streckersoni]
MDIQRKPLVTQNGSRLPQPQSKLKPPTSFKRSRSPEELSACKRSRTDTSTSSSNETLNSSTISISSTSSRQCFSSSVPKLRSSKSSSTLRPSVLKPPSTSKTKSTATVKPISRQAPISNKTSSGNVSRAIGSTGVEPTTTNSTAKPPLAATGGSRKRPTWDLKGRLQDMEELLRSQDVHSQNLATQLTDYNQRIVQLESQKDQLSNAVSQKEQQTSDASKQITNLRNQLRNAEDEFNSMKRKYQQELEDLNFANSSLKRQREALEGDISALQQETSGLKLTVSQLTSAQAGLNAELESTKLLLDQSIKDGKDKDAEIFQLKEEIRAHLATIEENNTKLREHETERRKLHNSIQELKGNIRVFCRVRPLIGDETLGNDGTLQHMNFPDLEGKILELEKIGDVSLNESTISAARRGNNKYEFNFDKVFQPTSTQAEIFEEISQLIQSALDGYNVCIFAYGQTGSGKTYTMEGPSTGDPATIGMIPRAVMQIFDTVRGLEDNGWQYQFEASFLEIYNETIRDLLGSLKEEVKHEIKLAGQGNNEVVVTNLTIVPVTTEEQIHSLLKTAAQNRAVAETKCNERSSRSHSVFRLKITGANEFTGEKCQGTLNLVDLAGSERLKESGSEGQRLKETQNINKSLSNLGIVILALANKDSHIPYRNSKLTYLLQNSLGGNSKTLMFVNVSPKEENFQETLNSLRFATKVNQCNIGTATKKIK